MDLQEAVTEELRQIGEACERLGADEEMTALVVASHRYNRTPLDLIRTSGGDLLGYVRRRLATWEAIFTASLVDHTEVPPGAEHAPSNQTQ